MKTTEMTKTPFTDLSTAELTTIGGEGFAYDAGRAIRFLGQCGSGMIGITNMVIDSILYQYYEQQ